MTARRRTGHTSCKPIITPVATIARMIENENPGRVVYKFVVKCADRRACREVQKHMKGEGFEVKMEKSFQGDHYGLKRFETYGQAKKYMKKLFKKFGSSESKKVNAITLGLEVV